MIVGVGCDLIEIKRIEKLIHQGVQLKRMFTEKELEFSNCNSTTLAGNFAVKEAVSKVFGTGFFGFEIYEIEVLRNDFGAPYICLYGAAKEKAKELSIERFHVSITNTKELAQAFVIGESL